MRVVFALSENISIIFPECSFFEKKEISRYINKLWSYVCVEIQVFILFVIGFVLFSSYR